MCLAEVLDQARRDLGANMKGLPDKPPESGSLDIEQVLSAEYAFRVICDGQGSFAEETNDRGARKVGCGPVA
jgi:hypothetical protein